MPAQSQVTQTYNQINQLINSSRFGEAFLMLKNRMAPIPALNKEMQKINDTENTYRYLLDYISAGFQDPSRNDVLEQIREALRHGNDMLARECRLADSSDIYSSTKRMIILKKSDFQSLLDNFYHRFIEDNPAGMLSEDFKISPAQAAAMEELFNFTWTLTGASSTQYEALANALADNELPEYLKLLLVSAMILGSTSYFDAEFPEILLSVYENSDSPALRARAITGILLISLLYSSRLQGNINLRSRLLLSVDDEELQKIIKMVLINIIRTYDTKRIDDKMRNEVIPNLMKINPEIIDKMRNAASESEDFFTEGNPEWEEIMENSDLGKKLQEINDMQLEGADVMVTAFSNLKNFSFFNSVTNWFLPFVSGHYEFSNLPVGSDDESMKRLTAVMCESDLHSFLISLNSMPTDRRDQMLKNLEHQMAEARKAMEGPVGETEADILAKKIRHTLQDLYRFFKFFRKKSDFNDPFASPFLASHLSPLLAAWGISPDEIRAIGEFYFQKKYFEEAAGMFELYDSLNPGDFGIWEKIGYCYDMLHNFTKAVEWYKKAQIIEPDNLWLIKKLSMALRNTGNLSEALDYFNRCLEQDPENYHLLMNIGYCLVDMGQPEKALQNFYHAQYLKPEKKAPQRAIAWTELVKGDKEKALRLYENLIGDENADKSDFLNAGHAALSAGDFKKAIEYYKTFIKKSGLPEVKSLVLALKEDSDTLKLLQIKTEDLRLVVDKIRYDR